MVGYGDMIPTSIPGKICAACCIVVGIMVMALPISVIGTNFSQAWDAQKQEDAEAAAANAPVDQIKLAKAQAAAHDNVKLYNKYSRRQIDRINTCYTEKILSILNQLWRSFKQRVVVLAKEPAEHTNQAQVRQHYISLAREESAYNADMEVVKSVCDAGLVQQFERVHLSADWIRTCLIKVDALTKDVMAMHKETQLSERLQFDAWQPFTTSKAWRRSLLANQAVLIDFRLGIAWEVLSSRLYSARQEKH